MVKDINPGSGSGIYYGGSETMAVRGGTLFFAGTDGGEQAGLWKSDGTEAGTTVIDIASGPYSSYPSRLTNVNGELFFSATDGFHGRELWKSDGTVSGTMMVKDINPGRYGSALYNLTNVNGTLFFTSYAKSDYSILISEFSQTVSTNGQSISLIADQNAGTATLPWEVFFIASFVLSRWPTVPDNAAKRKPKT